MEKEKDVKISFGAFDSELGEFEYTIPEGYEAYIKDGKVIVRKTESEDEIKINRIVACLENLDVEDNDILLKDIEWLKSLKDRVTPQPKPEWSEEDIEMIDWLIRCCEEEHKELCNDRYGHQEIVSDLKRDCRKKWDWLESLKNKVVPQNTWKPSDEQMMCLDSAIREYQLKGYPAKTLESLYEQLKAIGG